MSPSAEKPERGPERSMIENARILVVDDHP
jgi:hypothetical protein